MKGTETVSGGVLTSNRARATRIEEDWGSLTWVASRKIGNAEGITVGRVIIRSGRSNPRHCHPTSEEVLYLLTGKLRHTLGEDEVVLEPGDALVIPSGVFHNATTISDEDADMIVAYPTGERTFVPEPSPAHTRFPLVEPGGSTA